LQLRRSASRPARFGPPFGNQQPSLVGGKADHLADRPTGEIYTVDLLGQLAHQTHSDVSHTE